MDTKTKTNAPTKEFHTCQCMAVDTGQTYGIEGEETDEPIYGPCGANTRRIFAPGHDAKLKGVLIKCHLAGIDYHYGDGSLISVDPMVRAKELGWAHQLKDAKARQQGRVASRVAKSKDKATSTAATHNREIPSAVKVGRWQHGITKVIAETRDMVTVAYKTAKGETKEVTVDRTKLVY